MYLLALDASTKATGCAIFKDKELMASSVITASSNDLYKRIHKMTNTILDIVEQVGIDKIVMEEVIPDHTKNTNTFKALMYLQALIHIELHDRFPRVEIELVYPSSWRSVCGIKNGRGMKREQEKIEDLKFANKTYNLSLTSDDQADAICIGHAYLHPKDEGNKDYGEINWG